MEQKTFIQITGKDIKSNLANLTHLVFEVTDACNLKLNSPKINFNKGGHALLKTINNMSIYFILSALICCLTIIGCSPVSKETTNDFTSEKLLSLDVNTINSSEESVNLSELMESIEIIRLDSNTDEAFTPIFRLAISENYIVTTCPPTYPVKLFSRKDGKFIRNLGSIGQGPGEYQRVWSLTIDEKKNRVYLGQVYESDIYAYGLDGKYHPDENIRLPENTKGKFRMYMEKDNVIFLQAPYESYHSSKASIEAAKYFCWLQDMRGNVIQHIPVTENFTIPRGSSDIWVSQVKKEPSIYAISMRLLLHTRPDTLYHYNTDTNQLYPVYTSNVEIDRHIATCSFETPSFYYTKQGFFQKGASINPEFFKGYKIIQVDKKTGKGRYIRIFNDLFGGSKMDVDGSLIFSNLKDSYSFLCYHPLDLKSIIETNLKSQTNLSSESIKQLTQLKESLNEDDNDILVLFKFK